MKVMYDRYLPRTRVLVIVLIIFMAINGLVISNNFFLISGLEKGRTDLMAKVENLRGHISRSIFLYSSIASRGNVPDYEAMFVEYRKGIAAGELIVVRLKLLEALSGDTEYESLSLIYRIIELFELQERHLQLLREKTVADVVAENRECFQDLARTNFEIQKTQIRFTTAAAEEVGNRIEKTIVRGFVTIAVVMTITLLVMLSFLRFYRLAVWYKSHESFYRFVLEGIKDGVWSWDLASGEVYFSPRWFSMLGYGEDEFPMEFSTWELLVHPDDLPDARQVMEEYITTWKSSEGIDYNLEFRMKCKNGTWCWIVARASVIRDDNGKPGLLAGTHTDITSTKQYEEKLKEQKEEYEMMFRETLNPAVLFEAVIDEKGDVVDLRYLDVNPAWEILTGHIRDNAIGMTHRELFPGYDSRFLEVFGLTALSGSPGAIDNFDAGKNRHYRYYGYSPRPNQVALSVLDITETKRVEESLRRKLDVFVSPDGNFSHLTLADLFEREELQKIQDAFCRAHGVVSVITDVENKPFTETSCYNELFASFSCDRGEVIYINGESKGVSGKSDGPSMGMCGSTGLLTGEAPIMAGNILLGSWIVGGVRQADRGIETIISEIGGDSEKKERLSAMLEAAPVMNLEQFENVCSSLYEMSQQLSSFALKNLNQAQDIAVRREAEEKLSFAQHVIDNAQDQVWYINRKGAILFVNDTGCHALGYDREELCAMTICQINHDMTDVQWDGVWQTVSKQPGQPFEDSHVTKDGNQYPVEITARIFFYEGQEIMCAFVRDITLRKQARLTLLRKNEELEAMIEELQATNEEFEAINQELMLSQNELMASRAAIKLSNSYLDGIINSMSSIIIGLNESGHVTHWNRSAETFSGKAPREALDAYFSDVFNFFHDIHGDILRAVADHEERIFSSYRWDNDDGVRYFSIMVYPIIFEESTKGVIRIDEITEQLRLQDVMVQTEKMMSVGGLAAGMAHEINNPLGVILQGVQSFYRRLDGSVPANSEAALIAGADLVSINTYLRERNIYDYLDGIKEAAERSANIVANMLKFSRKSDARFVETDINDLLDEALDIASSDYDLKKNYDFKYIDVVKQYGIGLQPVWCAPMEIQQVLLNVIKNSAHTLFERRNNSQEGEYTPMLVIETSGDGDSVSTSIRDNGQGMDEITRKRIFEPFFTTKPVGVGTGLGLSVSYFIVTNNHGGTIDVSSDENQGTVFTITLPINGGKREQ